MENLGRNLTSLSGGHAISDRTLIPTRKLFRLLTHGTTTESKVAQDEKVLMPNRAETVEKVTATKPKLCVQDSYV